MVTIVTSDCSESEEGWAEREELPLQRRMRSGTRQRARQERSQDIENEETGEKRIGTASNVQGLCGFNGSINQTNQLLHV